MVTGGVDLHKRTAQAAVLTPEGEVAQHRVETNPQEIAQFFSQLPPHTPVAIEASVRKLTAKVRRGARVTKRDDRAQTPYQRLLASGILTDAQRQALAARYQELNPVALRAQIQEGLQRLWRLADRPPAGRE